MEEFAKELTNWFWENIVCQNTAIATRLKINVGLDDLPRAGDVLKTDWGFALCLFSDCPQWSKAESELKFIASNLKMFHSKQADEARIPVYYRIFRDNFIKSKSVYWSVGHYIDNEVFSMQPLQRLDRNMQTAFKIFATLETQQTESRNLFLLNSDKKWICDYNWDSEYFSIFLHSASEEVFSQFPKVNPRIQSDFMQQLARCCQWGGDQQALLELHQQYDLKVHEWFLVKQWLQQGVSSAAESIQAQALTVLIDEILSQNRVKPHLS